MRNIKREVKILLLMLLSLSASAQLSDLSDEFDNSCSLQDWLDINITEGWNASHLEVKDVDVSGEGKLTLVPWTTSWYQNYRSNLMYKEVTGDFVFTTYVDATNREGTGVPGSDFSLAGIMVRTPKNLTDGATGWAAGDENYIFLALGQANSDGNAQFEVKNTVNSNSSLQIIGISEASSVIRVARVGNAFITMYQLPGGNMTIRRRYLRNDMPATIQVGLVAYTDFYKTATYTPLFQNSNVINADLDPDPSSDTMRVFNPDIRAEFDYARYSEVEIPANLQGLDFSNPNAVANNEVLSVFGYASEPTGRVGYKVWKGSNPDWSDAGNWSDNTLPTAQDSILIPNCGCPEVVFPQISLGTHSYQSIVIENGGSLQIDAGVDISINLQSNSAVFENDGIINVDGEFIIINTTQIEITNTGEINCLGVGEFRVE